MNHVPPDGIGERRTRQRSWFDDWKTWWRRERKTTNGGIVLAVITAAIVLGVSGGFIVTLINNRAEEQKDREVADLAVQTAQDAYVIALTTYTAQVSARDLCLDGVDRSDANREQWEDLAHFIEEIGSEGAVAFAQQIRSGPVLSRPARQPAECGPEPTPPVPPKPPTR